MESGRPSRERKTIGSCGVKDNTSAISASRACAKSRSSGVPVAHARLRHVEVPEQFQDVVFTAHDLTGVKPISSNPSLRGFKHSSEPILATDKLRYVGEIVAMCVADARAKPRTSRARSRSI